MSELGRQIVSNVVIVCFVLAFPAIGIIFIPKLRKKYCYYVFTYMLLFFSISVWLTIIITMVKTVRIFSLDNYTRLMDGHVFVCALLTTSALSLVFTPSSRSEIKRFFIIFICPFILATAVLAYLSFVGLSPEFLRDSANLRQMPFSRRILYDISLPGTTLWGLVCFIYYCCIRILRRRQAWIET